MPFGSVIIPTLGRSEALRDCLESLWNQTNQDFEIIKVTEEGPLAELRNSGAKRAKGDILCFIDDDVICSPGWYEGIVKAFDNPEIAGVSGPAIITKQFRRNRDIFRFKWIHDLFSGELCSLPGHFSKAGTWTMGACEESCDYEGEVEFLEACNMAYRADVFRDFRGFDTEYKGVGDWSEPDLSFRIRRAGHKLWFSRNAKLEHQPSVSGAFKKRKSDSGNRMANYELFSKRWIEPCWQHRLYKKFMRTYYEIKSFIR